MRNGRIDRNWARFLAGIHCAPNSGPAAKRQLENPEVVMIYLVV
jgi:hypothetical protein